MGSVLLLIQAIAGLYPYVQEVLPAVETLIAGGSITDAEETQLQAAITQLNAEIPAAVAKAEGA